MTECFYFQTKSYKLGVKILDAKRPNKVYVSLTGKIYNECNWWRP